MDINFSMGQSIVGQGRGVPYTTGLTKANTAAFRSVVAGGARNARLVFYGDSTMRGQQPSGGANQAGQCLPTKLADFLAAANVPAAAKMIANDGGGYGAGVTMAALEAGDPRITHTGAWTLGAVQTVGGNSFNCTAAGSMSFIIPGNTNEAEIHWRDASSGRTFSWSVDGGAATQITSSNVTQQTKTTISLGSLGAHTLTLTWVAGSVFPFQINAYDSTRKEISVWNWGICGATSTTLVNDSDAAIGRLKVLVHANTAPDLLCLEGGIINDWRQSFTVPTSQANLEAIIDPQLAAGRNVILMVPVFDTGGGGDTANQQSRIDMFYTLAAAKGIGVFDIRKRWRSAAEAVARGFMVTNDPHPTAAGYADMAEAFKPVIDFARAA